MIACKNKWFYWMFAVSFVPLFVSHLDVYLLLKVAIKNSEEASKEAAETLRKRVWFSIFLLIIAVLILVLLTHNAANSDAIAKATIFRGNEMILITIFNFSLMRLQKEGDWKAIRVSTWFLKACCW